jgi:hypothetical protein
MNAGLGSDMLSQTVMADLTSGYRLERVRRNGITLIGSHINLPMVRWRRIVMSITNVIIGTRAVLRRMHVCIAGAATHVTCVPSAGQSTYVAAVFPKGERRYVLTAFMATRSTRRTPMLRSKVTGNVRLATVAGRKRFSTARGKSND